MSVLDGPGEGTWSVFAMKVVRERDELKARLAHAEADAEQAVHNEAFMERQRIVAWIRAKLALGSMDCSLSLMALESLRVVADEIERETLMALAQLQENLTGALRPEIEAAEERGAAWALTYGGSGSSAADPDGYRRELAAIICREGRKRSP